MISAPKFQFKSKGATSKKSRWVFLCIDTTTCLLIVGVFFLARHLHTLLPPPLHPIAKHVAPAAPKVPAYASTENAAAPAAAQPALATSETSATPATAPSFPPVEIPGASNNAASNLAGWITPSKPDANAGSANPANQVSSNADQSGYANPSTASYSPAASKPFDQTTGQLASARPASVSLGDSLMSVLSPSARAETIQPSMPPMKTSGQSFVPAARQQLKAKTSDQGSAPLTDEQKLSQTAQTSFDYVLDMAMKNPDIFGFAPNEKIGDAKLGDPLRVYTVTVSDRKSYQMGQPLQPILQPTNEWIFPVVLSGRVRFMIPIKRIGEDYVAETSSRALAMVYEKIRNRWPASEGFHPQLVVNANISTVYFTIPELPDPNLTDTGEMFEYNPTLSPASVILGSWR